MEQHDLFGAIEPTLPDGFRYAPDVVPNDLQLTLLQKMPELPCRAFDFDGFEGKRRTVSYGWKYDFDAQRVRKADDIPPVLLPARACRQFRRYRFRPVGTGFGDRIWSRRSDRLAQGPSSGE
ncbi:hypothetical protein ACVIDN_006776 [Rhizobium brockwellii]